MAQHDGQIADAGDGLVHPGFVLRIERAKIAGDGDGVYLVLDLVDLGQNGGQIQRFLLPAIQIVSSSKVIVIRRGKTSFHLEGFDEIWVVADVYVFTKGKDKDKEYKKDENQRDTFPKGITFTVDVPADADTWTKQKSKRQLSLVYFDKSKDKWVTFEGQKRAGNVVTVTLKEWIKDPPIGWGGTEPR